jgi:hypothetical protein
MDGLVCANLSVFAESHELFVVASDDHVAPMLPVAGSPGSALLCHKYTSFTATVSVLRTGFSVSQNKQTKQSYTLIQK